MGSLWIITEGVNPGEHVVVEGLQKVKDGIEVIPKTVAEPAGSSSPAPAGPSGTSSGAAAAPRGYHKTSV
jgi:membrane fusion protein (multidrug efflux system)